MRQSHTTHTPSAKPSLLSRLRGRTARPATTVTTTTVKKTTLPAGTSAHSTRRSKRGIMGRRRVARHQAAAVATPAHHHHQQRRPSMGDKISGAMMRLRGTLTRRPGLKAAGTRRAHGTDGRGARRY